MVGISRQLLWDGLVNQGQECAFSALNLSDIAIKVSTWPKDRGPAKKRQEITAPSHDCRRESWFVVGGSLLVVRGSWPPPPPLWLLLTVVVVDY